MTIELTLKEINEQSTEAAEEQLQWDPADELDTTCRFNARLSQGWRRKIWLREGIFIFHDQHTLSDKWSVSYPDEEIHSLWLGFLLSGQEENVSTTRSSEAEGSSKGRKYSIVTNGLNDKGKKIYSDTEQYNIFNIAIRPHILRSFTSTLDGELPRDLQHLIKSPSEALYERDG
ncbi:MAG: hypothetical protein AAF171_26890, partial [Cyanobacteria bacterium P01_A01_bin.116]